MESLHVLFGQKQTSPQILHAKIISILTKTYHFIINYKNYTSPPPPWDLTSNAVNH